MNENKYIVYKITNLINDKIYIGCHKTKKVDDNYMGSGVYLKNAQKKYGIENFKKEILEVFDNPLDMFNMESQIVNEEFIKRDDVYNLKLGGYGGFDHLIDYVRNDEEHHEHLRALSREHYIKGIEAIKWLRENDYEWLSRRNETHSKTMKKKYNDGYVNPFLGMAHSDEAKKKIGEASSKHQKGEGNSQFGTMWVYNLEEKISKKIKKEEFPKFEKLGWLKGRKMKF